MSPTSRPPITRRSVRKLFSLRRRRPLHLHRLVAFVAIFGIFFIFLAVQHWIYHEHMPVETNPAQSFEHLGEFESADPTLDWRCGIILFYRLDNSRVCLSKA